MERKEVVELFSKIDKTIENQWKEVKRTQTEAWKESQYLDFLRSFREDYFDKGDFFIFESHFWMNKEMDSKDNFNELILSNDIKVIGKFLHRFKFFENTKHLAGDIVELGVFKGSGVASFIKFLEIFFNFRMVYLNSIQYLNLSMCLYLLHPQPDLKVNLLIVIILFVKYLIMVLKVP